MPKRSMLKVQVLASNGVRAPRAQTIRSIQQSIELLQNEKLSTVARRLLLQATEVAVIFVDGKEIRRLNRTFRGKDKETDILSFESIEEGSLGELVIALDVIRLQARDHGLSLRDELSYMLLHGLLHLIGYDHEASKSAGLKMFGLQDRIFEKLRTRP